MSPSAICSLFFTLWSFKEGSCLLGLVVLCFTNALVAGIFLLQRVMFSRHVLLMKGDGEMAECVRSDIVL